MHFGEQFDPAATAGEYMAAFQEYGLDPAARAPAEMGRRLRDHPHAEPLAAAAAALLNHTQVPAERAYWNAALDVVFPADTFYGRWRAADRSGDRQAILRLAAEADPERLTPTTIWLMSLNLHFRQPPEPGAAARMLRVGLARYPSDFWLHYELCTIALRKLTPPRVEEAVRHGTAAVTLRPSVARAHHELAFALYNVGDLDRARAESREAIRLDPTFVWSHTDLGMSLHKMGDLDGALAADREAVRREPANWSARCMLGWTLSARGDLQAALAEYREAVRVAPREAEAHLTLGRGLRDAGDLDGALAEFREAARLKPSTRDHLILASQLQSAVPQLDAFRRGRKAFRASDQIHMALVAALPCNRDYALAVRLFTEGFSTLNPPDRLLLHRYDAACAAVRRANGEDRAGPVGADERLVLLRRAREWLRAELAPHWQLAWSSTPEVRQRLADRYGHWQRDPDLASVRIPASRLGLPAEERQAWEQLWTEVEVVRRLAVLTLQPDPAPE